MISMPENLGNPPGGVYRQDSSYSAYTTSDAAARFNNSAAKVRLAPSSFCRPAGAASSQPTKLVRVTLARGVVAWKAVAAD
jgi:hypothetical protein